MRALFAGLLIALLATPVMAGERPAGKGGLQLQGQAKLTEAHVIEIRAQPMTRTHAAIAVDYGVTQSLISQIRRRVIWRHI